MRAKEFIFESPDFGAMKKEIVHKVKTSNDAELIEKIYTVVHKSGLTGRIAPVLERDTDTKGYIDQLVNIIVDTPGKYEEKVAFINGYPNGYINIERMLSGEYIKFDELITGGPGAPVEFIHRVFDALKQVKFGSAKGPGEFGLAVLSPHIKITGKGDLNIGKELIEVKANVGSKGGRLGTGSLLNNEQIPEIIGKYITLDTSGGLNLTQLGPTLTAAGVPPNKKKQLATKLFTYIFKNKVDVSGIVDAVVSDQDPSSAYLKANYEIYQADSGFTGIMLMNFPQQACKYFRNPVQMANEIYAFSVYLISANPAFQNQQILAQVTLKPVKQPKNPIPAKVKGLQKEPIKKPKVNTVQEPPIQKNQNSNSNTIDQTTEV